MLHSAGTAQQILMPLRWLRFFSTLRDKPVSKDFDFRRSRGKMRERYFRNVRTAR